MESILIDSLISEYGQDHLFAHCRSAEDRAAVVAQLVEADRALAPAGLRAYISRARVLLADSKAGTNPLAECQVSVPDGMVVNPETDRESFDKLEAQGVTEVGGLCFVLVAGGLGERLGYPGIKISLPVDTQAVFGGSGISTGAHSMISNANSFGLFPRSEVDTVGLCYMALFAGYILEYQRVAIEQSGKPIQLPLAIMTSACTHAATVALLEDNHYFGLARGQVTLMMQGKVPCLQDSDGRIAISSQNVIEMKPHGHGDVHGMLLQTGLAEKWVRENRKWVFFFQDTNSLAFRPLCAALGVSKRMRLAMNSFSVPRSPGEASGAICRITNPNTGISLVSSVEYNLLGPLLRGGDVAGPDGVHSPYPGNCNILLFELESYTKVLVEKKGIVPEFVNPKYADSSRTSFKTPTRLECLMQDFALLMDSSRVGFTAMPRWLTFSVVKNTAAEGASKLRAGQPADCAFSGECEWFDANCRILKLAANVTGCDAEKTEKCFLGVCQKMGFRVTLMPSFGVTLKSIKEKIKGPVHIEGGAKSSLILSGHNARLDDLYVNGAFVVDDEIIKDTRIENSGWELVAIDENAKIIPAIAMRGYTVNIM